MNNFLKITKEHQEEMRRQNEQLEQSYISYHDASSRGILKPMSVRLPVDIIEKIDFIKSTGFWNSKQEVIYDMVCSAVDDFYRDSSKSWQDEIDEIGKKALDALPLSEKAAGIYQCLVDDGHDDVIGAKDEFVKKFVDTNSKKTKKAKDADNVRQLGVA